VSHTVAVSVPRCELSVSGVAFNPVDVFLGGALISARILKAASGMVHWGERLPHPRCLR